jgi:hypothetical protein
MKQEKKENREAQRLYITSNSRGTCCKCRWLIFSHIKVKGDSTGRGGNEKRIIER